MPAQYIWTLTGGELQSGNAQDATQTDQFNVYGLGNYIISIGGNLIVNGGDLAPYGQDSDTTIILSSTPTDPASGIGVTDTITLDGGDNTLVGTVVASTVTFTVNGITGGNFVSLDNADGGTTTLSMGGPGNFVSLNGDATNSVTSTGGTATVMIGSTDDNLFGYSSTVMLGGTGNTVTGGDEDFTVAGGQGSVTLGDGMDMVTMTGTGNDVTVGGGNDMIVAGGSDAVVSILGVDSTGAATWSGDADDGPVPM
ncbi:MAG TPA: hypothetical protein VMF58_00415, partial [Rhizomicrobium sp.]|nr:hypothetical protein [Rhizomicrobium sp.]HUN44406.1 hypothetical protein [Acetobacteraceae bacterium]